MNEQGKATVKHMELAEAMARDIVGYNPEEQNEMLTRIREIIIRNRCELIDETEKRVAFLKKTMEMFNSGKV